jgi:metabolite-proton symporter
MNVEASSAQQPQDSKLRMVVAAAFIGTVIEWYDFFLYGTAAALVFNKMFFPNISAAAGTMAAFATYAVGFFARPLGGLLFGYLGDKRGRKITLVWTLSLMGGTTFLVGCLPTYHSVGILAPILLVVLRFVQGIALGGEWGGAVLMTVEHGSSRQRGFYGSLVQAGVPIGLILATGVFRAFSSLPEQSFASWGWRAPFWIGIILTAVGFFVRTHIAESPLFVQERAKQPTLANPIASVLRRNWRTILLVIGARLAENASFYVFSVFILSYATTRLGLARTMVLNGVLVASVVEFGAILFYGYLSDKIGRRLVYMFGTVCLIVLAFPFFRLLDSKDQMWIWLAIVLALGITHAAMYAPQAAFFTELFGTNVRFSGASIGYQLSAPLAGGLAPIIATWLLGLGHGQPRFISVYLVVIGAISFVSVFFLKETRESDISAAA